MPWMKIDYAIATAYREYASNTQQAIYNKNRELWGMAYDITRNAKASNAAIDWRSQVSSPSLVGS
jgi:hypothetical protein